MDSPFGFDMPDPLDAIENSIEQSLPWPEQSPYPDGPLGGLEASIEDIIPPGLSGHVDELGRMLDAVEDATESQSISPISAPSSLDRIADRLGAGPEQHPLELESQPGTPDGHLFHTGQNEQGPRSSLFGFVPGVSDPGTAEVPFARQYRQHIASIHGSRTGIRAAGGRSEYYCCLHDGWVCHANCVSCSDFEQAETQADEGVELCVHSSEYLDSL